MRSKRSRTRWCRSPIALLARHQYGAGIIDFETVLDTERTVLAVEESLSLAQQNSTTAAIQLYKALGGGWTASAK
mgnify:CR=1 FL=1